jgi:hypothetical protein
VPEMPACEWERIWERNSFLTALNVLNRSALPVNALLAFPRWKCRTDTGDTVFHETAAY